MQDPELANRQPVPMAGEFFFLSRDGISFSAKSGGTEVKCSGTLYLSTLRMVVVADQSSHSSSIWAALGMANRANAVSGFDMPLATLYGEGFNQPIFGANNMTGTSPPLDGSGFVEDIKWCISFNNGGVGTFLPLFFRLLAEMRQRLSQDAPTNQSSHSPVEVQSMVNAAFVDPSDPTRLFVPQ
uniref:Uncharacterized protein n=1 Tax=Haptolina brevifila TaxID=156173 RepID=A0A7S2I5W5_9EUKA|mmetsp:Transcript_61912/g.122418  ORF Transcript_61912/g.122418 Transcript_61912/m.122418 type:complete len:184 (+) Transcript_61912:28-579(+)